MKIIADDVWFDLEQIKKYSPLIHNITNYVVMEQTANSLLAIGASPVMAHACEEVEDMTSLAQSLVLNIGTLSSDWVQSMHLSLIQANIKKIPVVFDPVGCGATPYRTQATRDLLATGKITTIRGNASEIVSIAGHQTVTKGVDSVLSSSNFVNEAIVLALLKECIVCMSGAIDIVTDGKITFSLHNGHPLMAKVTGMGCTATSLIAAFLSVNSNALKASINATAVMGVAGELAALKQSGPGSFKVAFIDALYNLSLKDLKERLQIQCL